MQRRRSFLIIVSVVLALIIAVFISGSLSAPDSGQKNTELEDGKPIVVSGKIVCLPHKDTSGPVTLECAYGIQDESGAYYALRDTTPDYSLLSDLATDTTVQIEGIYYSSEDSKYRQSGTIEVKAVIE